MKLLCLLLMLPLPAFAADQRVLDAVLMCESSNMHYEPKKINGKPNPRAGQVRWGDDGLSRGRCQFCRPTFMEQAAIAKKNGNWPFGKPRWLNEQQQLWLMNDMFDRGVKLRRRWTCYRKLYEFQPMD